VSISGLVLALAAADGCEGKVLRLGDGTPGTDGGSATGGSGAMDGGAGQGGNGGTPVDSADCQHGQVKASEVVWIGDSWVTSPGTQVTRVRDLAFAAGAIGASDDYVVRAAAATTMSMIASQYDTQEASASKVKVLIMDGGGWDTITGLGSDTSVATAADAFTRHLAKVASDGTVQDIIYFLYPVLATIPRVADLHPLMKQACDASKVPCYFLDLQPSWADHPEYTDSASNIQASKAGATVIGDEIWKIMQQNCIAQ
jgi:hypothetical protein